MKKKITESQKLIALLGIVLMCVIILLNSYCYSWLLESKYFNAKVSAAASSDIIKYWEIEKLNPKFIKIEKAENSKISPIIYFSIEGEAENYILHINPVKLNSTGEYLVPVNLDLSVPNMIHIISMNEKENISCKIRLKYLNEFIDESKTISFSREYLIELFEKQINEIDKTLEPGKSEKVRMVFSKLSRIFPSGEENTKKEKDVLDTNNVSDTNKVKEEKQEECVKDNQEILISP